MTGEQHVLIKRDARNLVAIELAVFTGIFLISLIWRFDENFTSARMLIWFGFFGLVSVVTSVVYYQCKLNYVAVRQVLLATTAHLVKNEGQWPKTWNQLKASAEKDFDLDWASTRVIMHFDADTELLAMQHAAEFDSIKHKTPCFVPNSEIAELQNVIHNIFQAKRKANAG